MSPERPVVPRLGVLPFSGVDPLAMTADPRVRDASVFLDSSLT
jgi:hypothetical protein